MNSRVLFIISDTGGGHRSAANSIITCLKELEVGVECELIDLLRASRLPGIQNAPEIYSYFSTGHIWMYNLIFRLSNFSGFMNMSSRLLYQLAKSNVKQAIDNFQPTLVVVIHPLAVRPICDFRAEFNAEWPVVTVITDLVNIHASWASPRAELFLLPTLQAFQRIRQLGVPEAKIHVTGFPVHPRFSAPQLPQTEIRQLVGLPQDHFTVLITSGGAGGGQIVELVEQLEQQCPGCILLVVTGKNQAIFQKLNERTGANRNTFLYRFVDNMEQLMAASDVVVTKAGPGTIMEAATMQRPLILTGAVGLQEEGNINFVIENGLGTFCPTPVAVACEIERRSALNDPARPPIISSAPAAGTKKIASYLLNLLSKIHH